jgi:ABC-2 type transport system permease protein
MKSAPSVDAFDVAPHPEALSGTLPSGGFGLTALWTLYLLTLRQHLHGKRWWVVGFLFLLAPGLAILMRATAPDVKSIQLEFMLGFMFIPQALLPLVALLYASGIIRDEQEEQTMTYLLIRPIPKWALYVVKLLATLTTTVLLATVFTALTYAAIYVGGDTHGENIPLRCLKAASIHALAVVSYCCLFGLISLLTKWSLLAGILYAVIFEAVIANLEFGIRFGTIIYYTRVIAYRSLDFAVSSQRGTQDLAANTWKFNIATDPKLLEHPQLSTCIIVLLAGSLVCTLLAAFLCSQREFHVKTPEKN